MGRSKEEYELMFGLTAKNYESRILGCGDGPASFNAEASKLGNRIVSINPLYDFSGAEIARRFDEIVEPMISQVLADYDAGRAAGRYQTAKLPSLPFVDGEFGLALCSHLLFLYSEILDRDFHIAALRELCRVSTEVRIFPLLTLARKISPHLEPVQAALQSDGWQTEIVKVNYELQKGGNEMLRVHRVAQS